MPDEPAKQYSLEIQHITADGKIKEVFLEEDDSLELLVGWTYTNFGQYKFEHGPGEGIHVWIRDTRKEAGESDNSTGQGA